MGERLKKKKKKIDSAENKINLQIWSGTKLTFVWTGNGDVGQHDDTISSHWQVAVVTAFLCQFNQVSQPGGNGRST